MARLRPENIASALTLLYSDAESALARGLASRLAAGIGSAEWAGRALSRMGDVERFARGVVERTNAAMRREVAILGRAAQLEGAGRAAAELAMGSDRPRRAGPDRPLSPRVAELATRLQSAQAGAVISTRNIYRGAVQAGMSGVELTGRGETALARRRSVQRALDRALDVGITGVRDSAGRNWTLAAYAEMASTTAAKQIEVEGHLAEMARTGRNLLIVSSGPQECPRCRPWDGKILTRDGSGAGGAVVVVPAEATPGRMVTVRVAGSLAEAIQAGLLHPRCRCRVSAYRPGLTGRPPTRPDPEGQAARDRLRALERRVRQLKLRAAAALDDEARARALALVRAKQAEIRAHVGASEHLGIRRDTRRERPDLGYRATRVGA